MLDKGLGALALKIGPDWIVGDPEKPSVRAGAMRLAGAARAEWKGQGDVIGHFGHGSLGAALLQIIHDGADEGPVPRVARQYFQRSLRIGQAARGIGHAVDR